MSKIKEKKTRVLKHVNVVPNIIIMILFCILFVSTILSFDAIFVTYVIESKVQSIEMDAARFTESLNLEHASEIEAVRSKVETGMHDFALLDKNDQVLLLNGVDEFAPAKLVDFEINGVPAIGLEQTDFLGKIFDGEDFMPLPLIRESVFAVLRYVARRDESLGEPAFTLTAWMKKPLPGDEMFLYYQADIVVTNRDAIFLLGTVTMTAALAFLSIVLNIISFVLNIVSQKRSSRALYYDSVTGENNWLYLKERGKRILKRNKRRTSKRKFVMVDFRIDKYQNFCLFYGQKEGEELAEKCATVIKYRLKRREIVARYAEAEFGILMLYEDDNQLRDRIKQFQGRLQGMLGDKKITFSVGLAETGDELDVDTLFGNATMARKNIPSDDAERFCWYDEELKKQKLWERHVEDRMEAALANGEFKVYIQPKYDAATRTLGGGEALIRWISEEDGFIGPGQFIPIFEKNGFITKIDDFMISSVAKLQAKWIEEGKTVVPISVNVSRAHFTKEDLAEHIAALVEEAGAPKEVVELELTESAFFEDKEVLIKTVQKLRDYGFAVSMDDFGADYSSLNSLKDMPLDVIKLDAGFFRGVEQNQERGSVIVAGIISMAKDLGMHIVAEGIEQEDQVVFLAEHGCDLIQGFYFAKPMPVADYENLQ